MNSPLRSLITSIRILVALTVISTFLYALHEAQSQAPTVKTPQIGGATKRLFENRVPEHLPIKVKIKRDKESSFRDLNNENWARDFELEVKNIGDKPIYTLYFQIHVPDAKIQDSY